MIKTTSKTTIACLLLKQYRLKDGARQSAFAKEVNSSAPQWSKVETGKAILTVETVLLACDYFKITPGQLFNEVETVAAFLIEHGWQVVSENQEEDLLVKGVSFSKAAAKTLGFDKIPSPDYVVEAIQSNAIATTVLDALVMSEKYAINK